MTTKDKAELLDRIGPHEGCELADFWYKLTDMYLYNKDYMTEDFWLQIALEIEIQFEDAVGWIMEGDLKIEDDEELMNKIEEYIRGIIV